MTDISNNATTQRGNSNNRLNSFFKSETGRMLMRETRDYFNITLGLMLYTFGFTVFLLPYEIVTGGIAGIGAIIFYATKFPVQWTFFIINAVLIVAALKELGLKFLAKTIYATIAVTIMLDLAQKIVEMPDGTFYKLMGEGNDFMSLIIGCMLTGTALAIVFLSNGSTGGTDIIAAVVNKFHDFSLGTVLIGVDLCIIGSCLFIPQFGEELQRCYKVVFGLCTMFIECFTLDYVMNSRRESVQFMIFSREYDKIARAITKHTDHTLTILDGHGWYTGTEMKVICLLAKKNESVLIFRLIKMIDPRAFVSQSSVIGVYGEGFDQIKVKVKNSPNPTTDSPTANSLVFATNNQHKLEEIRSILGSRFEILSLNDIGCHVDIPETANTLEGNAIQKARYIVDHYGYDCFADDTGLEVPALGGEPGVHSARYAEGTDHNSEANMQKLLHRLEGVDDRRAQFRTVICLARKGDSSNYTLFEGVVKGTISKEKHGTEGFGYDPIFVPEGYNESFAQLGMDVKNHISHRARAVEKLVKYLA